MYFVLKKTAELSCAVCLDDSTALIFCGNSLIIKPKSLVFRGQKVKWAFNVIPRHEVHYMKAILVLDRKTNFSKKFINNIVFSADKQRFLISCTGLFKYKYSIFFTMN